MKQNEIQGGILMKFRKKMKQDKGASNTISFIVIMGFIMVMLVSFIDVGLYFNAKNQMQSAADNGARSVAMFGGNDNAIRDARGGTISPVDLVKESVPKAYKNPTANKTVVLNKVVCYPENQKIKVGDPVYCDLTYTYNGIAGGFGLFNLGRGKSGDNGSMTVRGTSVSEVTIE